MILIADSGSTKTTWYYSDENGKSGFVYTSGINPFFRIAEDIYNDLKENLKKQIPTNIHQIFFYGAGVINPEKGDVIRTALSNLFPETEIEVASDLLAAARATLANKEGIACILGTGSNSCFYNGIEIVKHVPPLGFILGDEGSGAVLGKKLVGDFLKGMMPEKLSAKFRKQFQFEYAEYLEKVYKTEKPNKFLAQFVPFLSENIVENYCLTLVENSFDEFIKRNILQYDFSNNLPVCFVGSVAFFFSNQLEKVLKKNELKCGPVLKEPINGLIKYHSK